MARTLYFLSTILSVASAASPLRVDGLIAAVVSPFTADGMSLNLTAVEDQAKYLQETGISNVFVAGTTGESLSMTMSEREALVETWETVGPQYGISFIVHVGAEAIGDVQRLARHAAKHGAVAVGMMPSVFFKPATITNLGQWVEVAAAAAPSLPFYYYHIPENTGVLFNMIDLLKEVDRRGIPNFAGVKYTGLYETRAFPDLMLCNAYDDGKYEILGGREELMVEAMAVGTVGFIGSQFNYGGDIYTQILREPDQSRRVSLQLAAIVLLEDWINGVPAGVDGNKMMANLAGIPVGSARMPSMPPSAADYAALQATVAAWCTNSTMGALFDPTPKICTVVNNF